MFPEEFPSCSESLRDLTWLSLAGEPSMLEEFPFLPKSPPSVQTSSLGTALCQKFPFPGCSIVPCHQKLPGILLGSTTSTGTQQKQSKEIFFFFSGSSLSSWPCSKLQSHSQTEKFTLELKKKIKSGAQCCSAVSAGCPQAESSFALFTICCVSWWGLKYWQSFARFVGSSLLFFQQKNLVLNKKSC